jgi:hypothetical protein
MIDPVIESWYVGGGFYYCGANGTGGTWSYTQSGSTAYNFSCWGEGGHGLYVGQALNGYYTQGTTGYWYWNARPDSYIQSVSWNGSRHVTAFDMYNLTNYSLFYAGIWSPGCCWRAYDQWGHSAHYSWTQYANAAADNTQAVIGIITNVTGSYFDPGTVGLDGASITVNDNYAPGDIHLNSFRLSNGEGLQTVAGPRETTWFDSNDTTIAASVHAWDRGLGLKSIQMVDTGERWSIWNWNHGCGGRKVTDPCPTSVDTPETSGWSANAFPDGITQTMLRAYDINGRAGYSAERVNVKVDKTPPSTINLSGRLWLDRRTTAPDGTPAGGLFRANEELSVTATDTASGVANIEMLVDGVRLNSEDIVSYTCPTTGCPATQTAAFAVRPSQLSEGVHRITVVARDQIAAKGGNATRHTSSTYFDVWVPESGESPDEDPLAETNAPVSDASACIPNSDLNTATYCEMSSSNAAVSMATAEPSVDSPTLTPMIVAPRSSIPTGSSLPTAPTTNACNMRARVEDDAPTVQGRRYNFADGDVLNTATENGEDIFANPDIAGLITRADGTRAPTRVRLIVPYDIVTYAQQFQNGQGPCIDYQSVYDWVTRQLAADREPMISFERARTETGGVPESAPGPAAYRTAITAFMDKFPTIRVYTAWNEPNNGRQPFKTRFDSGVQNESVTRLRAKRAGVLWGVANELCKPRNCMVLPGDFADGKELTNAYRDAYFEGMGKKSPSIWAIHTYGAIWKGAAVRAQLQRFLDWGPVSRATQVWVTEAGSYYNRKKEVFGSDLQSDRLKRFFESSEWTSNLGKFKRFYYYKAMGEKQPTTGTEITDRGLLNYKGQRTRAVYCYYRTKINPTNPC